MSAMIIWLCLALAAVTAEMFMLTLYLLAAAAGLTAGGIAAYLNLSLEGQITSAAVVTIIASCGGYYLRRHLKKKTDVKVSNPDIGERVTVKADQLKEDGCAEVLYRGARWIAYAENTVIKEGIYTIVRIDGTRLVLAALTGEKEEK